VAGVDTVERYQGSERDVMIVSATESNSAYIRRNESFLFDMRRLNVALSRARHKVIVVASEQVLDYIAQDPTVAAQSQLWKNLRQYWCTHILYDVEIAGQRVRVRGFQKDPATTSG
jgi:superfamily I DNA and/or RNA helicase